MCMNKVDLDFSHLFDGAKYPKERMYEFGSRIQSLSEQTLDGDIVAEDDNSSILLSAAEVSVRERGQLRLSSNLVPGIKIIDQASGHDLGNLASTTRRQHGFLVANIVVGALHYMPTELADPDRPYSITIDHKAFPDPKLFDIRKDPVREAFSALGQAMLILARTRQ